MIPKLICWIIGHYWDGGRGDFDYQYLHCKVCNQNIYSIKDGKFIGYFDNGRLKTPHPKKEEDNE